MNEELVEADEGLHQALDLELLLNREPLNGRLCSLQVVDDALLRLGSRATGIDEIVSFLHIVRVKDEVAIDLGFELVDAVGGDGVRQHRGGVIRGKRVLDGLVVVDEVEHKSALVIGWADPVQTRQGLHC